jgi:hypothetical protein
LTIGLAKSRAPILQKEEERVEAEETCGLQISRKGDRRTVEFFEAEKREGPEESDRAPRSAVASVKFFRSSFSSLMARSVF